jgi:nucleoid-associated protein YgaU
MIEVHRGQSWWKLAELYLGSGTRWRELRKLNANAGGPPELLILGSVVVVPETAKAAESLVPGSIRVRKGDSLWSLAHQYLGHGSAWGCLASANPMIVDFTHLAVGTSVRLPEGDALKSCRNGTVEKVQKQSSTSSAVL